MSYIYEKELNGTTKYRVYYMYQSKKIYIGIYETFALAKEAYAMVHTMMQSDLSLDHYPSKCLSFKKFISLANFKNNGVYFNNPIYLEKDYFIYYLADDQPLLFDLKDLFFISNYKINKRGQYLFITIGGRQENLLKRFGISNHATYDIDYSFKNGNRYDFRRANLIKTNHYKGVDAQIKANQTYYRTRILLKSYLVVGHYESELLAAIAYNKAIDFITTNDPSKFYEKNEFPFLTKIEYETLYGDIVISKRLTHPSTQNRFLSNRAYRGVSKDKTGLRASIGFKGKQIYLGIYSTEQRAAQAYNLASLYLYGQAGFLNEVTPLTHPNDEVKIANKLKHADVLKNTKR